MIEDAAGVAAADEICALPGSTASDRSRRPHRLPRGPRARRPALGGHLAAAATVVEACRRHDVAVAAFGGTPDMVPAWTGIGVTDRARHRLGLLTQGAADALARTAAESGEGRRGDGAGGRAPAAGVPRDRRSGRVRARRGPPPPRPAVAVRRRSPGWSARSACRCSPRGPAGRAQQRGASSCRARSRVLRDLDARPTRPGHPRAPARPPRLVSMPSVGIEPLGALLRDLTTATPGPRAGRRGLHRRGGRGRGARRVPPRSACSAPPATTPAPGPARGPPRPQRFCRAGRARHRPRRRGRRGPRGPGAHAPRGPTPPWARNALRGDGSWPRRRAADARLLDDLAGPGATRPWSSRSTTAPRAPLVSPASGWPSCRILVGAARAAGAAVHLADSRSSRSGSCTGRRT